MLEEEREEKQEYAYGILSKIGQSFGFAFISWVMWYMSALPLTQVVFLRSVVATVLSGIVLVCCRKKLEVIPKDGLYWVRGFVSAVAIFLWGKAIQSLGVNESIALGYSTTFWLLIMARVFYAEKLTVLSGWVIGANLFGMFIILRPDLSAFRYEAVIFGLLSTLCWAVYDMICKKQTKSEHYLIQTYYTFFCSSVVLLPGAMMNWGYLDMQASWILLLTGGVSVVNVTLLFLSYKYAPVIVLIPFGYTRLLFAMIFSYSFGRILPSYPVILGAFIIMKANLLYFMFRRKLMRNEGELLRSEG